MFNEQTCTRFTWLFVWSSPCPKYLWKPYSAIFLKSPKSKDIKTDISNCQKHKYTNTNINTQIKTHTYSFVEVPRIPNIWYISKQLLIKGCQKWYSQVSKVIRYDNWSDNLSDNRSDIRSDIRPNIRSDIRSDICSQKF